MLYAGSLLAQYEKIESPISLLQYRFFDKTNINDVEIQSIRTAGDIRIPFIVLRMLCTYPSKGAILGQKPLNIRIQWKYLAVSFIKHESIILQMIYRFHHAISWSTSPFSSGSSSNSRIEL